MDDYDARERVYSVPIVIGGAALVAVLVALTAAVIVVSHSSAAVVHRKTSVSVPAGSNTAIAHPASSTGTAPQQGLFADLPRLPVLGQLLAP